MDLIIQLIVFAVLLLIGLIAGRANEKRHYRELELREKALRTILVFNERRLPSDQQWRKGALVVGSVVIAEDYFKRVVSSLKSLVGGRLTAYESLMDRGRREAVVRMKEEARRLGASMVFNVRFETASLSEDHSGKQTMFSAEFIAYGTAVVAPPKVIAPPRATAPAVA